MSEDKEEESELPEKTEKGRIVEEFDSIKDRRLKDIFDARSDVREVRNDISLRGQNKNQRKLRLGYRGVLETYLTEVEPLFYENDKGKWLWSSKKFGKLVLVPPTRSVNGEEIINFRIDTMFSKEPEVSVNEVNWKPVEVTLEGVSCLFEYHQVLSNTWEYDTPKPLGNSTYQAKAEQTIPIHVLDRIFRTANRYLSDIGISLDLKEDKGPAEI